MVQEHSRHGWVPWLRGSKKNTRAERAPDSDKTNTVTDGTNNHNKQSEYVGAGNIVVLFHTRGRYPTGSLGPAATHATDRDRVQ